MDKYEEAALSTANKARSVIGLPPVEKLYKGDVGDMNNCVITNTIYDDDLDRDKFSVQTDYYAVGASEADYAPDQGHITIIDVDTNDVLFSEQPDPDTTNFLGKFDDGDYPNLEIDHPWEEDLQDEEQ